MKHMLQVVCIFGFLAVTASAFALPKPESAPDAAFDNQVKSAAQEAILVGDILRNVAADLAQDEDICAEADEYFIRALWEKAKSAVKGATSMVKAAAKNAYTEVKEDVKKAAMEIKQKANEKAIEIVTKFLGKFMGTYALDDSHSRVHFVKAMAADIERVGLRLQKQGMSLLES